MTKNAERDIGEIAARQERRETLEREDREAVKRRKREAMTIGGRVTPLRRLAHNRLLGATKHDIDGNSRRLAAGERYARDWQFALMSPVKAINLSGWTGGSGDGSSATAMTCDALFHAAEYRRASQALGPYFASAVDPIVLNEDAVEEVGRRVSGYGDRGKAIAVVMDRLRGGLDLLVDHYTADKKAVDTVRTTQSKVGQDRKVRPDAPKALATHRSLAGMS
jgi:hypothetical protein